MSSLCDFEIRSENQQRSDYFSMNTEQMIATEHPYIIKIASVCGGRPIIKGTRTPVRAIVEYYRLGMDAYQILTELPYITAACFRCAVVLL